VRPIEAADRGLFDFASIRLMRSTATTAC
jgi:hypothetical protein